MGKCALLINDALVRLACPGTCGALNTRQKIIPSGWLKGLVQRACKRGEGPINFTPEKASFNLNSSNNAVNRPAAEPSPLS